MVKLGGQDLMVVLAADRRIDVEKLEKITGQAVALETEAEFKDLFPGCAPGTMPPFGELYGIPTYVDSSLAKEDYIVFEAGNHTDAIKRKRKAKTSYPVNRVRCGAFSGA
jgi:Ala-tRNA(Pro) deacylase